jgi:hypothetical protein
LLLDSSYVSFLEKRRHALMKSLIGCLAELRS